MHIFAVSFGLAGPGIEERHHPRAADGLVGRREPRRGASAHSASDIGCGEIGVALAEYGEASTIASTAPSCSSVIPRSRIRAKRRARCSSRVGGSLVLVVHRQGDGRRTSRSAQDPSPRRSRSRRAAPAGARSPGPRASPPAPSAARTALPQRRPSRPSAALRPPKPGAAAPIRWRPERRSAGSGEGRFRGIGAIVRGSCRSAPLRPTRARTTWNAEHGPGYSSRPRAAPRHPRPCPPRPRSSAVLLASRDVRAWIRGTGSIRQTLSNAGVGAPLPRLAAPPPRDAHRRLRRRRGARALQAP